METVAELMTPNPIRVSADEPIGRCARRMMEHGIRHMLVVNAEGVVQGVLTDVNVHRRGKLVGDPPALWFPQGPGAEDETAGQATTPIPICRGSEPLTRALRRLARSSVEALAVVDDDDRVVGIVTEHDAVRLAQGMMSESAEVRDMVEVDVIAIPVDTPGTEAFTRMLANRIRHLVIVDKRKLVGVVSLRDVLCADSEALVRPAWELRGDGPLHTLPGNATLADSARLMAKHNIGCAPLVDSHGRVTRVITRTDLIEGLVVAFDAIDLFGGESTHGER